MAIYTLVLMVDVRKVYGRLIAIMLVLDEH